MTWLTNAEMSFGMSSIIYNNQKEEAIAARLKSSLNYTKEDIKLIFEQYDIKKTPENLEKLEDEIIQREKNDKYIKKANDELVV